MRGLVKWFAVPAVLVGMVLLVADDADAGLFWGCHRPYVTTYYYGGPVAVAPAPVYVGPAQVRVVTPGVRVYVGSPAPYVVSRPYYYAPVVPVPPPPPLWW